MLLDEGCVHLMREAIRGPQRQSDVIDEDRVLVASGDCVHLMKEAIRGHQRQRDRSDQARLESTGCVHLMKEAIRGHHRQRGRSDQARLESTGCMHLGVGKGVRVDHTAQERHVRWQPDDFPLAEGAAQQL